MTSETPTDEQLLTSAFSRLSAVSTAIVLGGVSGTGLMLATIWLVVKGGPDPGPHLGLLSQYFPGYSVTVGGAFIGFAYAFVVGAAAGLVLTTLYNRLAR